MSHLCETLATLPGNPSVSCELSTMYSATCHSTDGSPCLFLLTQCQKNFYPTASADQKNGSFSFLHEESIHTSDTVLGHESTLLTGGCRITAFIVAAYEVRLEKGHLRAINL